MEQYLSSMIDSHKRYTEAFVALVEEYNTLGEHISSLGNANQSYRDASREVQAQFNAASGHHISDLTILNLNEKHERFILACENFRAFIDSRFEDIRELVVALHTSSTEMGPFVSPGNAQLRDRLVLPSNGQGDMEYDTEHGDEADMPEGHKMAVPYALPEEAVENNTAALEETVDQKMAAS